MTIRKDNGISGKGHIHSMTHIEHILIIASYVSYQEGVFSLQSSLMKQSF